MGPLRRYFVVYDRWGGQSVQKVTECIGRFLNDSTAIAAARDYEFRKGIQVLDLRRETAFQAKLAAVGDALLPVLFALIRAVRIGIAAGLGLLTYAFLISGNGIGDIPISQLTLSMIMTALMKGIGVLISGWACLWIAFGPSGRQP